MIGPTWAHNLCLGAALLCALSALGRLPRAALSWQVVRHQYGGVPWRLAGQMLRYGRKSRRWWWVRLTAVMALVSLGLLARRLAYDDPWQLTAVALAGLALAVVEACQVALPPCVLYLGSSAPRCVATMAGLNVALPYCRTVSLLDPRAPLPQEHVDAFFRNDLRTTSVYEWRSVVHHLMDIVPVIVVDAGDGTAGVREEVARIERLGYHDRALFVADDVARDRLLAEVGRRLELMRDSDRAARLARQAAFERLLAAVPAALRSPALVARAAHIQHAELRRFLRECKGADPDTAGALLEDIPSRATADEEARFLRDSRALEEVEILLCSALEDVQARANPLDELNLAKLHNALGVLARLRRDWPRAERHLGEAIASLRPWSNTPAPHAEAAGELATAQFTLGEVAMARYRQSHDDADRRRAEACFRESIAADRAGDVSLAQRRLLELAQGPGGTARRYRVVCGELAADVAAATEYDAFKAALAQPGALPTGDEVVIQPEGGAAQRVPLAELLRRFDEENEATYQQVAAASAEAYLHEREAGLLRDTYRVARGLARRGPAVVPALWEAMKRLIGGARIAVAQQAGISPLDRRPETYRWVEQQLAIALYNGAPAPGRAAAYALVLVGEAGVQQLMACLADESSEWLVKLVAAWALGLAGDRRAVAPLRKYVRWRVTEALLGDPLSRTARQAIRRLGHGQAPG